MHYQTIKLSYLFCLVLLVLAFSGAGCGTDVEGKRKIDEKIEAGEYEEAVKLAHKYFSADKLLLLTNLEYIAYRREKSLKSAYKKNLSLQVCSREDKETGLIYVAGKVFNDGEMTIRGFSIKITCIQDGKAVGSASIFKKGYILPGKEGKFTGSKRCLQDHDGVSIEILDFSLME